MKRRIGLLGLVLVIVLTLLLPGTTAFASPRTAMVELHAYNSLTGLYDGPMVGTLTVIVATGPEGSTLLSGSVSGTTSGHSYALYLVRGSSLTIVDMAAYFDGADGTTNLNGVALSSKNPTRGQMFQVVDATASAEFALSDPIVYK